jgi:hypothetical protein
MKQQLLSLLDNENNQKYYRYLLLDPLTSVSEFDFVNLNNIKDYYGQEAINTVVRTDIAYNLNVCPQLVTLGKPNHPIEKRLLHFSLIEAQSEVLQSKRYVCSWLVSQYPPDVTAKNLADIGTHLTEFLGGKFVPFYEPFRMQLLHQGNMICPEFMADLLSCLVNYNYLTVNKTIATINNLGYKPKLNTLFISEEAKFYNQYIKVIFDIYLSQANIYTKLDRDITQIDLIKLASAYHSAYACGLKDLSDQKIFTFMTLRYGNLFSNRIIKNAIEQAKHDAGSLVERFKAIDRQEFSSIKMQVIE